MGLLARAIAAPFRLYNEVSELVAKDRRLLMANGGAWSSFFGRESHAGKTVSLDSALQLSTVWACIKVTAQAVSCLPLPMYERQKDNSRVEVDDPIRDVIGDSPNADQTSLEYWESTVAWLMANGNAYSEIVTTGKVLSALQPIASNQCNPTRNREGELVYRINDRGRTETLPRDKVFHIKGFGQGFDNPDLGLSPISNGVHTLGAAMAAGEAAGKMFASGMQASGVLTSENTLNKDQRAQLQTIMETYTGSTKAGKLMILEAGLEYKALTLNPDDAQLLETRRFDVEEICRWFGTPPIVIGHSAEGQTMWGSGVEHILISWLTLGIDPLCDRIEARIKKQLIRPTGSRRRYAEFNREALLQMDSTAKANFLSSMGQNGYMTRNEGRAKLNLPRDTSPVADQLTVQTNLAPLEKLGLVDDANAARSAFLAWLGVGNERKSNEQAQAPSS